MSQKENSRNYINTCLNMSYLVTFSFQYNVNLKNDQLSDHPLSVMAKHRCLDAAMSSTRTVPPKTSKGTLWGRGTSGSPSRARQPLEGRPQEYNLSRGGWNPMTMEVGYAFLIKKFGYFRTRCSYIFICRNS